MQKTRNILFLFDIDGTLIKSDGAGSGAVKRAFKEYFGKVPDTQNFIFDGKTDPRIFSQLAEIAGIPPDLFSENRDVFEDLVYEHMSFTVREKNILVIDNIREILQTLESHSNVYLGVVTGNDIRGAYHKLNAVDLKKCFRVGAYGNDEGDRNLLPQIALSRAQRLFGVSFNPEDVWIIGDTPNDIESGKKNNFSTIAVATGRYSMEELSMENPSLVTASLTIELFLNIIKG